MSNSKQPQTLGPEAKLLTPADVEREYGLKRSVQATMRYRREIPFVRISKRDPRYRRDDLDQWVASRAIPAMTKGGGAK